MRGAMSSWRKAVSAAVSVAMLLPTAVLVSTLLLGVTMQTEMSRRAAANAADLKAEEAKKLLRVTILRGPSNESLVNIYAAGKLPIQVDYLIAIGYDGGIITERDEIILALRPGDNVTVTPGWLDPGLEGYNNDFWRMRREVRSLILHTSDGNTFYASWGPWNKEMVIASGGRGGGGPSPLSISATCTVGATVWWDPLINVGFAQNFRLSCNVIVSGSGPPYSYSMFYWTRPPDFAYPNRPICSTTGTVYSGNFNDGCSNYTLTRNFYTTMPRVEVWVYVWDNERTVGGIGTCRLDGLANGVTSCVVIISATG